VKSYLLDSSILIALSRAQSPALLHRVREVLASGALLFVCEPVAMEFLAGVQVQRQADADRYLNSFGSVRVDPVRDFRAAGILYSSLRARGVTPRGSMDCLIAVVAMSSEIELTLAHDDRDFESIAQHVPLRQERWPTAS
jgi:predicted nucleic acid-binding protein